MLQLHQKIPSPAEGTFSPGFKPQLSIHLLSDPGAVANSFPSCKGLA